MPEREGQMDCSRRILVTKRESFRLLVWRPDNRGLPDVTYMMSPMTKEESIAVYKTYSRMLYNVSFRIVGDSGLAEEIMQDTVLKFIMEGESSVASPFGSLRAPLRMTAEAGSAAEYRKIGAWLRRTCVRASIDALRRLRRERLFLDEYAGTETAGEPDDDPDEGPVTVERVKSVMRSLPEPYRLILTLILIEGFDYEEISDMTGEKEGALRVRFSRARKMLAERLRGCG